MSNYPLAIFIALAFAPPASAGDYITTTANQIYYGERESLRREGDVARAWIRVVPVVRDDYEHVDGVAPTIDDIKPGSAIESILYSFKCTEFMIGEIQWVRYADLMRQEVIDSWTAQNPKKPQYSYVLPESVGESLLKWACKVSKARPNNSFKPKPLRGSA